MQLAGLAAKTVYKIVTVLVTVFSFTLFLISPSVFFTDDCKCESKDNNFLSSPIECVAFERLELLRTEIGVVFGSSASKLF